MNKLPKFSEEKATEAAIVILKMAGGRMKYIRLLKLLYLSDREAFEKLGRSITNDSYCSMDYGQVPSRSYDLVKGTAYQPQGIWEKFIQSPVDTYYVQLKPTKDKIRVLSESELDIVRAKSMQYIDKKDFELADITKGPEYERPPKHGSIPTPIEKLLHHLGYTDNQVEHISESLAEEAEIQAFFGK
jgi:hypothetical protein